MSGPLGENKFCSWCDEDHPVLAFGVNKTKSDGLQSQCRKAKQAYARKHYRANKEIYLTRARNRTRRVVADLRNKLLDYFSGHPCVDCGNADPTVLEFDHLDGKSKLHGVGRMIRCSCPWEEILSEIAKCEVVCCNCHSKRTAARSGWWWTHMSEFKTTIRKLKRGLQKRPLR